MDIQELWEKALRSTEIIRSRAQELATFESTELPYVFLAESSLNVGDTVVRQGKVLVERPSLILPSPRFEGFEFSSDLRVGEEAVLNFLLVRGVKFPSLRYHHELTSLDLHAGPLRKAIEHFNDRFTRAEDIRTGLVVGPEDAWQFSILILVGSLVIRAAEGDLRRLLDAWRRTQNQ